MQLLTQLQLWYQSLPDHLSFTDLNLYVYKDQGNLGSFFFLHITYYSCVADLTRITLPGYTFPAAVAFQAAPADVKTQYQGMCFEHAGQVSTILRKALEMGETGLDDYFASTAAFESTKIQVIYVTTLVTNVPELLSSVTNNVQFNLSVLDLQHWNSGMPNYYVSHSSAELPLRICLIGVTALCNLSVPGAVWVWQCCGTVDPATRVDEAFSTGESSRV